jgi:hypothetical protein
MGSAPRFSVSSVLAGIALIGGALAALKSTSTWLAAILVTLVFLLLLTSLLGAILGSQRRAWLGFAVFGWGYWIVAFGPWFQDSLRPALATSLGILDGFGLLHGNDNLPAPPRPGGIPSGIAITNATERVSWGAMPRLFSIDGRGDAGHTPVVRPVGAFMMTMASPTYLAFERTVHALMTVVFGVVGAGAAHWGFTGRCALPRTRAERANS